MKTPNLIAIIAIIGLWACSAETNPYQYLTPPNSKESHQYYVWKAEQSIDNKDFEGAVKWAEKANELDPGNEEGAVILGFAYMSIAGIDAFSLATKLINQGEDAATGEQQSQTLAEFLLQDEAPPEGTKESNPLAPLQGLLGLDQQELDLITVEGNQVTLEDGRVIQGAPSEGLFKDFPILIPKTAPEARAAGGKALGSLAKAIRAICPFIVDAAKTLDGVPDPRHTAEACPPSNKEFTQKAKSHFIWSFAHLTEAIAFNSVVLYDPSGEGANIVRRSDALADPTKVPIQDFINGIDELSVTMELVLPTDPNKTGNSMLFGMVNDLHATSAGFDQLPGMPESMTKSIDEALQTLEEKKSKIKEASDKASGPVSDAEASSSALKESLTEGLADNLKTQIEQKSESGELSPEQKAEVCASYASISTEALAACEANNQ